MKRLITSRSWGRAWAYLSGWDRFEVIDLVPLRPLGNGDWLFQATMRRKGQ